MESMRLARCCMLRVALFLSLIAAYAGKIVNGVARVPANGTFFLSKFCFDFSKAGNAGYFNITLHSQTALDDTQSAHNKAHLVLFDDQASSYPEHTSAWNALSCEEKLKHARSSRSVPESAKTPEGFVWTEAMQEHIRPRWWYVAISDCSGSPFSVAYTVHTWNAVGGTESELSVDHYGIIPLCCFFLLTYCALVYAQSIAHTAYESSGKATHPLLRLLTVGIRCGASAMLCFLLYYSYLASTGQGLALLWLASKICQKLSKFFLMSMLLLISQGRCISSMLTAADVTTLWRLLAPFAAFCLVLESWGEFAQSRTYTTDFVYDTRWGFLLVLVDVGFLGMYSLNLQASYGDELNPSKKRFYHSWGLMYGAWFLVLPALVVFSQILAPWVRFRVVFALSSAALIAGYASLVAGLWPSNEQSYFALDATELVSLEYESQAYLAM